ncbi:MAG: integrase [Gammaproteobacteria bacterium]|nr:integrase [Gammaproteobacteria bacterium]
MNAMNTEVYDALVDAGADETKAREAAKSVARYDSDLDAIKASLLGIKWMVGFVLAFIVAMTWQVFG